MLVLTWGAPPKVGGGRRRSKRPRLTHPSLPEPARPPVRPRRRDLAIALSRRGRTTAPVWAVTTHHRSTLRRPDGATAARTPEARPVDSVRPAGAAGVCGWLASGQDYSRRTRGHARTPVADSVRDRQRVTSSRGRDARARRAAPAATAGLARIRPWGTRSWQMDGSVRAARVHARGARRAGRPPAPTPNYSAALARPGGRPKRFDSDGRPPPEDSYLVDSASSHMLVSKIKPCKSKYKQLYGETANGSLNQLSFI